MVTTTTAAPIANKLTREKKNQNTRTKKKKYTSQFTKSSGKSIVIDFYGYFNIENYTKTHAN